MKASAIDKEITYVNNIIYGSINQAHKFSSILQGFGQTHGVTSDVTSSPY